MKRFKTFIHTVIQSILLFLMITAIVYACLIATDYTKVQVTSMFKVTK